MTEISAAIGLAQVERVKFLVSRRQKVARMFAEAVSGCEWLVPQSVPENYENSYYTYVVKYYGEERFGIKWKEFYNRYIEMGGDGFYSACKVPYLEPVFKNLEVNGTGYKKGLCPIAEDLQSRIMQFKTNYRDLNVARQKADALKKLIEKSGR